MKSSQKHLEFANSVVRKISSKKNVIRHISSNFLLQKMKELKFFNEKNSDYDCHSDGFVVNNKHFRENLKRTIERINFQRNSTKRNTDSPKKSVHLNIHKKSSDNLIGREIKIIICDDENIIYNTVARMIRDCCNTLKLLPNIKIHQNGIECLYNIYTQSLKNEFYDIIFMDETMPCIKGSEVIAIIKNMVRDKNIKPLLVYSLSGYDEEFMKQVLIYSDCDGILTKPVQKQDMLEILRRIN
jgi:CheY-like chemotaxis protein